MTMCAARWLGSQVSCRGDFDLILEGSLCPACAADANILINMCRLAAQRYYFAYQEPMPVEQLVRSVSDTKQGYTQYGGQRPFGVSLLYAGWWVVGGCVGEGHAPE